MKSPGAPDAMLSVSSRVLCWWRFRPATVVYITMRGTAECSAECAALSGGPCLSPCPCPYPCMYCREVKTERTLTVMMDPAQAVRGVGVQQPHAFLLVLRCVSRFAVSVEYSQAHTACCTCIVRRVRKPDAWWWVEYPVGADVTAPLGQPRPTPCRSMGESGHSCVFHTYYRVLQQPTFT